jgi:hypothetical protein
MLARRFASLSFSSLLNACSDLLTHIPKRVMTNLLQNDEIVRTNGDKVAARTVQRKSSEGATGHGAATCASLADVSPT